MRIAIVVLCAGLGVLPARAQQPAALEATTAGGDRVWLHPNGRWEYADAHKAEQARRAALQYPENQGCPSGMQGGFFGFGRCIAPGDKDYNRGTLNPARR
jgi:hypothetical protein